MTTQTDLTLSPAALGAAVLGIAPESTAGKILARPKANRLTAAQSHRLALWMQGETREFIESVTASHLAVCASREIHFRVTESNADSVRRDVLGIRRPAKVKPAVQEHFCVSAGKMQKLEDYHAELREMIKVCCGKVTDVSEENKQLRADVSAIAYVLSYPQLFGSKEHKEMRAKMLAIAERNGAK